MNVYSVAALTSSTMSSFVVLILRRNIIFPVLIKLLASQIKGCDDYVAVEIAD